MDNCVICGTYTTDGHVCKWCQANYTTDSQPEQELTKSEITQKLSKIERILERLLTVLEIKSHV
jgi:hypothetical protein